MHLYQIVFALLCLLAAVGMGGFFVDVVKDVKGQ
jgi:hypothetical protein